LTWIESHLDMTSISDSIDQSRTSDARSQQVRKPISPSQGPRKRPRESDRAYLERVMFGDPNHSKDFRRPSPLAPSHTAIGLVVKSISLGVGGITIRTLTQAEIKSMA